MRKNYVMHLLFPEWMQLLLLSGCHNKSISRDTAADPEFCVLKRTGKRDQISSIVDSLHWLPVKLMTEFKIPPYQDGDGKAPSYHKDLIAPNYPTRTLQPLDAGLLVFLTWEPEPSAIKPLSCGTTLLDKPQMTAAASPWWVHLNL